MFLFSSHFDIIAALSFTSPNLKMQVLLFPILSEFQVLTDIFLNYHIQFDISEVNTFVQSLYNLFYRTLTQHSTS